MNFSFSYNVSDFILEEKYFFQEFSGYLSEMYENFINSFSSKRKQRKILIFLFINKNNLVFLFIYSLIILNSQSNEKAPLENI
jgi:hypothetical protein